MKETKLLKTILFYAFAFIIFAYLVLAIMLKSFLGFVGIELSSIVVILLRILFVFLALLHIWGYPKILTYISKDF